MRSTDAYVVRALRPAMVLPLAVLGAWVAFSVLVVDSVPSLFIAVAVVLIAVQIRAQSLVLRVDGDGVRIGRGEAQRGPVRVPWRSIEALELRSPLAGEPELGVRLRAEAPLPGRVTAVIRDRDGRAEIPAALRVTIPAKRLDLAALRAAIPPGGPALEQRGA